MRFDPPKSPAGLPPVSILEVLYAEARLIEDPNDPGAYMYAGESDIDWASQQPLRQGRRNRVTLIDNAGNQWSADIILYA